MILIDLPYFNEYALSDTSHCSYPDAAHLFPDPDMALPMPAITAV